MTKAELLKYLSDCKDLEMNVYNLENEKNSLHRLMNSLGNANDIPMPDRYSIYKNVKSEFNDAAPVFITIIALVIFTIVISLCLAGNHADTLPGQIMLFIVFLFVGGFIALGVGLVLIKIEGVICDQMIQNRTQSQYQSELSARDMRVRQDLQRVADENRRKPIIQSRIDDINRQITQTTNTLDKLYDVGVVYSKYRALVPIVMFCEYLESGRCEVLEGHEGAYNIYENELRQNIIIAKLDVVINRLDQIKQNQYMLADAIERGNRQVQMLCNATQESARRLENIQNNAAITAENSRIAANNTYVIGKLEAYRMMFGK